MLSYFDLPWLLLDLAFAGKPVFPTKMALANRRRREIMLFSVLRYQFLDKEPLRNSQYGGGKRANRSALLSRIKKDCHISIREVLGKHDILKAA